MELSPPMRLVLLVLARLLPAYMLDVDAQRASIAAAIAEEAHR